MVDYTIKDNSSSLSRVEGWFHCSNHIFSWVAQLKYNNSNLRPNWDLDYFHVKILAILSTCASQLTSPFSISQFSKNIDECSFKHFIKNSMTMKHPKL